MQWGAVVSRILGEHGGKALQLLSGLLGLIGVAYGLQVLMVERAKVAVCSAEVLEAVGQQSFLKDQKLTVEVAGAVVQPGVWQLSVGARVAEAIEKAGGFSQRADRNFAAKGLNLASDLKDGEKIYVPFEDEQDASGAIETDVVSGGQSAGGSISINNASAKELQTLPGIGEVRAQNIIDNRPYVATSELTTKGIVTASIFEDIEALIDL